MKTQTAPDVRVQMQIRFCDDVRDFLDAMRAVWPECSGLAAMHRDFMATAMCSVAPVRELAQKTLISTFHAKMKPYYARCRARDGTIFTSAHNIDILDSIDMVSKWNDSGIDETTRATIFDWLGQICTSSELYGFYEQVPEGMLSCLSGAAMQMAADGGTTMDRLPATVDKLMSAFQPDELESFAERIMAEPSSMESLMGLVGAQMQNTDGAVQPQVQGLMQMVQTMVAEHGATQGL